MTCIAVTNGLGSAGTLHPQALCIRLINIEDGYCAGLQGARGCIDGYHHALKAVFESWYSGFQSRSPNKHHDLADRLLHSGFGSVCEPFTGPTTGAEQQFVLTQYAPQALLSGSVLQNLANPANCHEPLPALAHQIHSWHVGHGVYAHNHAVMYRQVLQAVDLALPGIQSSRFADSAQFLPSAWCLSAYRLSLSVLPQRCCAEILGAALFELGLGVPELVQDAARASTAGKKYNAACMAPACNHALTAAKSAIANLLASEQAKGELAIQVARGYFISRELFHAWHGELVHFIQSGQLQPAQAMVQLVQTKAKYAVGYHDRLKLGGQVFDELIVQDPARFVEQLARSPWVVAGNPDASPLLGHLIAFGGPMFRVFSDAEVEVIRSWIVSLALAPRQSTGQALQPVKTTPQPNRVMQRDATAIHSSESKRGHVDLRAMYHCLLNIDHHPEVRVAALDYAITWLARSAKTSLHKANVLPFERYTHHDLRAWFDDKALAQVRSYCPNKKAIEKTRDEVIDEAVQLCPMILIDGAWVQRWTNVGMVDTRIGSLLYKIFSDEIGNGDPALNHPNIYRDLMQQMGLELPDFRTREFAYSRHFADEAFAVPVFWLALSQYPRRFLPETLGLNLAMELSGVGGAYRNARDELHHHGFSTLFVDLHNTIDNVSSGHSAMAIQAIELYMDDLLNMGSASLIAANWQRIWTGYCALSPPKAHWMELFSRPRYVA
ncbi:MAG TPA: iron-containing redox enzyme family protein [Limnobacter sp.]|nr:iron-containing redox enzyme family protein [Limnobacter sp.]